jgi:hypothetical protein
MLFFMGVMGCLLDASGDRPDWIPQPLLRAQTFLFLYHLSSALPTVKNLSRAAAFASRLPARLPLG